MRKCRNKSIVNDHLLGPSWFSRENDGAQVLNAPLGVLHEE